ncbi:hypothetical protein [Vibrio parahaemolyticus]|nr:hypothetical protein [Vibrio parahaemolyticus]
MKSKDSPIINEQFWDALFFNGTMPWDRNQTPNAKRAEALLKTHC